MKFSYRFSNLLGSVYRKGNVTFTPDGNSIISPVGNRITIFDLKNNKSETLPIESKLNITCMALSPDGYTLILVNEEGEAMLCSLISKTVTSLYHFHRPIHAIKFSPDGKKFAVTKEKNVLVFHAPGKTKEFNPFVLYKTFYGALDDTVCIDWTSDSRAFCVGSKDMNTRMYGAQRFANLIVYSVGGHTHSVVGAFFEKDSLDVYSIGENGHVAVWQSNTSLEGLIPFTEKDEEVEHPDETEEPKQKKLKADVKDEKTENKILYTRKILNKVSFRGEGGTNAVVTSAAFHKNTHILVTGFEDGAFFLHEMPEFNMIHSLSISDQCIATIDINSTGDWVALACSGVGQLLVWEWQSETYVLKQQGHFNNMSSLAYSPDAHNVATGGDDGKVKVWNMSSGFCFVTFSEHQGGITGVTFNQNGQVVLSSSLDGTVRAFDLNRYRNFRTFTSPRPAQFSCLAIDNSGEIVCAGGLDTFEIFVWSMKTGRLLEVLTGHEGPISSLSFSPVSAILASGSWDKTVKLWDVFETKGAKESLSLITDVLAVTFRPDGQELAVATLDSTISFWNPYAAVQTGSVEGRHDLGLSRREADKITAKKSSFGKAFSTICYSADGNCILAAGRSKNVCIYSVADQMLMKKFEISCNLSFDGMLELLDKRKMSEWGNLALVDQGEGDGKTISLPGVRNGDMSSRHWKPEVRVTTVQFSPTGRSWAATTTEGLLVYSLDQSLVFDPFELETEITPASVRKTLNKGDHSKALLMSFRLNEQHVIQEVVESIPVTDVDVLCRNLPETYVDKLLSFVANQIESSAHLEFYLTWVTTLLVSHGPKLKQRSQSVMAVVRNLQKNITRKYEDIGKLCDHNKYLMEFIVALSKLKKQKSEEDDDEKMDTDDQQLKEVYSDSDEESIQKLMNNFSDSDT